TRLDTLPGDFRAYRHHVRPGGAAAPRVGPRHDTSPGAVRSLVLGIRAGGAGHRPVAPDGRPQGRLLLHEQSVVPRQDHALRGDRAVLDPADLGVLALAQAGTAATRLHPLRPRHQEGPSMGHAGNTSVRPVAAVRRADGPRHRHVAIGLAPAAEIIRYRPQIKNALAGVFY